MPSVQLEHLRPQIAAVTSQYQNSEIFCNSLIALLESYSGEINESPLHISPYSLIPKMNIPFVVLNQLEVSMSHLAKTFPDQTKVIADKLWKHTFFETKKIAIMLISNLPSAENNHFFERIESWVNEDLEQPILSEIFEQTSNFAELFNNPRWIRLIETWINSKNNRIQKIGLMALTVYINSDPNLKMPLIFQMVEPLISNPHVFINNELIKLVKSLIVVSKPETAAFLMHMATIYPKPEIYAFIRKCLPFFDPFFAEEIKIKLTIL